MIVHTLKMCMGDTGPEQSLVLFSSVNSNFCHVKSICLYLTLNAPIAINVFCFFLSAEMFKKRLWQTVDPDQTAPIRAVCSGSTLFASILNSWVMLGIFLQQTTSADDIFRCIFFLGALRVDIVVPYCRLWKVSRYPTGPVWMGCVQWCYWGAVSVFHVAVCPMWPKSFVFWQGLA